MKSLSTHCVLVYYHILLYFSGNKGCVRLELLQMLEYRNAEKATTDNVAHRKRSYIGERKDSTD